MLNCNKKISLLLAKISPSLFLKPPNFKNENVCPTISMLASKRERQKIILVMLLKKINLLLVPVEQPFDGLKPGPI